MVTTHSFPINYHRIYIIKIGRIGNIRIVSYSDLFFFHLDVIARFQALIDKVKPHVDEIITTELEERELNAAQEQLEKAEKLAKSRGNGSNDPLQPIYKPQRTNWFSEKREAAKAGKFPQSRVGKFGGK